MYSDTEGVTTVSAKYWFQVAKYEQKKNIEVRHQHGGGLATVFVLDTSESMADGGFQQMKDIFISIISEISKNPQYDDNVAVVTFGQTIKFTHYLTNNYESLKQCLDHISCSGPSPIAGAIALSSAVFYGGGLTSVLGEWHVRTRVIVMTDGRATDSTVLNGPEDQAFYDLDRVKAHLLQVLQNMGRKNPVTFIPVGDPDMSFLEFMSGASNSGRLVLPSDAKQLGRYSLHMQIAPGLRNPKFDDEDYTRAALSALRKANKGIHLEHKDMDNIRDLVANKDVFRSEEDIDDDDEELSIGDMERYLLPLGTRVRRGPHWQWKNQDSDGPGTVVGYNGDLWTRVEWDTGLRMNYRYNLQEEDEYVFDIVECSEPRVLLDGEKVAVGCLVTRGPDWKWGDQDGYKGQTGVVYKFKHRGIVYVRWQSGVKSNYRFGFDGKFDVQVCDPFSTELDSNQKDAKVAEFPVQFDDPSKQSYAQGKKSTVDTSERSNIPWQISRKSLKDKRHEHNLSASDVNVCAFCNSKIQNSDVEIKTERNPSYSEKLCSKGNNTNSPVLKGPNLLSATDETFHAKITKEESNTSLDDTSKECKKPLQASEGQHENYVWQWQDCKEKWITYPDSINDILNSRFQRNSTSIIAIEMDNQCYRIDMQRFQQRNTATNEVTEIRQRSEEMRYLHGGGVGTVFVLDTSASMEGEGFKEMKEIFLSIVDEISRSTGPIHDNVSVVTFGKEVKFVQYPTNRYQDLRHCLDDVQCGGSSPLTAGIILSTAVFNEPGSLPLGDWHVRTRIIVITDGRPTDSSIISGSDDPERYNQIQVKETFCSQIHQIGKLNQITFVPVGHSDMLFFEMALGVSKTARMIHACDSRQLGKYATNVFIAAHIQHEDITTMDMDHFQRIVSDAASGLGASDTDLEEIKNIISYKDVYRSQEEILDADDEEFSSSLIPVGTRVRRGPHWKWRNQDSDGPGTVVGYNTGFSHYGWTRVEWDNGVSLSYRYNLPGLSEPIFDVVECHEPRVLIDGELIAVGCRVTRGPDWKWDDQDGGKGQVGAVYRLSQSGIVHVRWPNGTRSNYRFGFDGKFDVQLIDPLESTPNTLMSNLPVKVEFENDLTTKDKTKSENSEVSNISSGNSNIPWPRDANINDQANGYRNLRGECNPADDQISSNPADIQSLNRQTDDQTSLSHSCSDNQFSGPHADDQTSSYSVDNPISTSKTSSKKVSTHNLNDWNVQSNRQISTFKGSDNSSFLTNSEESSTKKSESDLETSSAKVCNDFIWQWKNSSGNWTTYPDDINEIINERYSQNPAGVITILHNNQCVRIVMSSFQQVTPLTGATTKIRRLCPVDNKK